MPPMRTERRMHPRRIARGHWPRLLLLELLAQPRDIHHARTHNLHQRAIVHRDIKLENVLLDERCNVRLIDFGFACSPPEGADGLMRTNCGTPAYLSPEQLNRKKTGGYTRVVDWWAFGCVAFELMTGRRAAWYENLDGRRAAARHY